MLQKNNGGRALDALMDQLAKVLESPDQLNPNPSETRGITQVLRRQFSIARLACF